MLQAASLPWARERNTTTTALPDQESCLRCSEVLPDSSAAAAPSSAALPGRALRDSNPGTTRRRVTSKPVRRRRVDKTNTVPDDEDSTLDTSAVAADRGHCTRALRRYAGPASTRGARRPCGAADGARGASHGYPSEFKVRRGRSCGCSIMRSDGTHVLLKSLRQTCSW